MVFRLQRRGRFFIVGLAVSAVIAACGGSPVSEGELPTVVPTYTPAPVGAAARATVLPATATVQPAGAVVQPATSTSAPTAEAAATATAQPTATVSVNTVAATAEIDVTAVVTDTADLPVEATPAPSATDIVATATSTLSEAASTAPATIEPTAVVTTETTSAETPTPATSAVDATEAISPTEPAVTPELPSAETPEPAATDPPQAGALAASAMPADLAVALTQADPAVGEQLTAANGCIACHGLAEGQQLVGPSWYNVGITAATRVEGQSAEEYLYHSIVAPNDYVVPPYPAMIMPQIYGETLSTEDLANIIAYLLSTRAD